MSLLPKWKRDHSEAILLLFKDVDRKLETNFFAFDRVQLGGFVRNMMKAVVGRTGNYILFGMATRKNGV